MAVGKLGYPDLAEQALREGKCDMIMLGRPLLADPDWCNKAYAGQVDRIRPCIGCQEGCINEFVEGGHPQCAVNPRTGFEDVFPPQPEKADTPKRIGVIGGGPAGITFALTAAQRGHKVEILEKSGALGGKVIPGSVPLIKFDFANYLQWLRREVAAQSNITVKLNTFADTNYLKAQGYDAVVFANGTRETTPAIPGIEKIPHVQAVELLMNPELLGDARRIVVVGGGVVGCETAYWLAYEKGRKVHVVEMLPNFMEGTCTANRGHLIHYLEKAGVDLVNCAKVMRFDTGLVYIERNVSAGVPDPYNTWQPLLPRNIPNPLAKKLDADAYLDQLSADLVVLAMGGRADEQPFLEAQVHRVAPEVHNIGDSFHAGRVLEANRAAYHLACLI